MFKNFKTMLNKITSFITQFYARLRNNKLIKALLRVYTLLLSYRIIKYFWYFNKVILYLLGLLFVGVNWSDFQILTDIKLLWDGIKLYFLSFFNPETKIIKESIKSTKTDIKDLITAEHLRDLRDSGSKKIVSLNETPKLKSLRDVYLKSFISDGNNSWSFYEILTDPWVIFTIVTAITISGVIILNIYDVSLNDITTYTFSHVKMGFVATVTFIGKVIRYFTGRDNQNPRPPINPNNPDLPINPPLNLDKSVRFNDDKGKGPMVLTSSPLDDQVQSTSQIEPVIFGPEKPPFFDVIQSNPILKNNKEITDKICMINSHIKELETQEMTKEITQKIKYLEDKKANLGSQFVDTTGLFQESDSSSTGSLTPTPSRSKSPIDTDNLDLPQFPSGD
jgi:hypothetical protein